MESIDRNLAQRVWNRVNGCDDSGPDTDALTALMSQELTDAAVCIRLAKRWGGQGGPLLRLARQCQQNAGYLRGICSVAGNRPPAVAVPALKDEPVQAALRKCYVNSLRRMRAYDARSQNPDYGPVFQKMADAMGSHCATLLELIGRIEG